MPYPGTSKEVLSSKRQIEAELHEKLEAARLEYEAASKYYKEALKRCDELPASSHNGNGNFRPAPSASEAVRLQGRAFETYRRALDQFNRFILYGDIPDS